MGGRQDRFDIQFMRGVAVLAVVLFHAFPGAFGSGFLGVDVFFVISGFLITGIVLRGLERRDFSFKAFYVRRAKRLLPASLITLGVTTLLALVFLTRSQMADYAEQLLGSLAFVANFVLATQTGYFQGAAETKPLLHIWSLSLEEQFYFVAPFLLWLTPLRARPWLLVTGVILSFTLCLALVTGLWGGESLAFFMLPTRAWELLFGAVCAWVMIRRPDLTVPGWAKLAALAAIIATCAIGFDPVHPRGDAVIVVVATGLILLGQDGWLPRKPLLPVKIVGDWSYSLYLIHWPLFSFAYISWGQPPPMAVMIGLALLATGLAWLQYRFVDQAFRGDWSGFRINPAWGMGAVSAAIVAFAVPSLGVTGPLSDHLQSVHGLHHSCDQPGSKWVDLPDCRTSETPIIAVWGDSFAMQWVSAFADLPMVQLTKSACAPVKGVAQPGPDHPSSWPRDCISFNDSAAAAIAAMPSVRYVIISSPFGRVLHDEGQSLFVDGKVQRFSDAGRQGLVEVLQTLIDAGKVPVIIAPPPRGEFDAGRCNERQMEFRPSFFPAECSISNQPRPVTDILNTIGRQTGVTVFDPARVLCERVACRTRSGDAILYYDAGHVTEVGARYVMEALEVRRAMDLQ